MAISQKEDPGAKFFSSAVKMRSYISFRSRRFGPKIYSSYFSTQNHFHGIEQGGRGRDSRLKGLEFESLLKEDGVSVIFD